VPVAYANPTITPNECPTEPPPDAPPDWKPDNCTPAEGTIMQGIRTVTFNVSEGPDLTDGPILEVVATLVSDTENVPGPGPVGLTCPSTDRDPGKPGCQFNEGDNVVSGTYSFTWDAATLTPYNGAFTLHVDTTARRGLNSTRTTQFNRKNLRVDNAPAKLGAPKILATTTSTVTLEWPKAPEPDVQSYTVYRAVTANKDKKPADGDFKAIANTTTNSIRDERLKPNAYWYKVLVTRRSVVTPETGISSPLSDRSGAGVVVVPEPTPVARSDEGSKAPAPERPRYQRPPLIPQRVSAPPPVPDAPFSAVLPYKQPGDLGELATGPDVPEEGADPRGAVLPVAVGAFLFSSALALGRMPY
jgi:hypothetical protein